MPPTSSRSRGLTLVILCHYCNSMPRAQKYEWSLPWRLERSLKRNLNVRWMERWLSPPTLSKCGISLKSVLIWLNFFKKKAYKIFQKWKRTFFRERLLSEYLVFPLWLLSTWYAQIFVRKCSFHTCLVRLPSKSWKKAYLKECDYVRDRNEATPQWPNAVEKDFFKVKSERFSNFVLRIWYFQKVFMITPNSIISCNLKS